MEWLRILSGADPIKTSENSGANSSTEAYGAFLWGLMRARGALFSLLGEADKAAINTPAGPASSDDIRTPEELIVQLFHGVGNYIRADIGNVVRHNCAGAAFQIVYLLLESLAKSLGLKPGYTIRAGHIVNGEHLTRVLWACRNAFSHGDEWKRVGTTGHPNARESFAILHAIGFADPANINLHDVYSLISGGNTEHFLQSLFQMAKELSDSSRPSQEDTELGKGAVSLFLAFLALAVLGIVMNKPGREERKGYVAIQIGEGDDAVTIPIAGGNLTTPQQITVTLREEAVKRLPPDLARSHREFEARGAALFANFNALLVTAPESPQFYRDLLDLCDRTDQLHAHMLKLENPIQQLQKQRGIDSKEALYDLYGELLSDHGFEKLPYREVNMEMNRLSTPQAKRRKS